ncbi:Cohesin subunit psc3 [Pichia kudriavzevii]|uniref:Cohesin subunit psc3 n=1 Tax=Pichia kudriavzevii TaxID=4909 RepID=A0A1V2LSR2_PICKU|nr:Cohesin subunit psc3 [Pichia kudriavzevii]
METAQSWYEDFTTDDLNTKFEALKDFLNLILRSSGCIVQLSRHDVTNTENAKDTVNELQRMFARQKYHEFPMMYTPVASNNKEWKNYPSNALDFISSIILIAGQTGILYEDDDQFIELLLEWLGAMSTSNVRALRYVSTVFGLNMQNVLCKLSVNLSTFIDKFIRQLRKENDTLRALIEKKGNRQAKRQVESANERIRVIENNVEMYKKQKKIVDNIINDFFNTLFVHRYRDVAPEIRLKCVDYLGEWMDIYPEIDKGYLEEDDNIKITSLIFLDNEDQIYPTGSKLNPGKFMKELAKFVSRVEKDLLNAVGVVVDIKEQTKKPLKQLKLTDLQNKPKKRKLINNSEGESESESDQGGEDENDPIENSDDEVEGVQDEGAFSEDIDENMEFSDVDGDDIESDSLDSGKFKRQKTNASAHGSLASSFPFTQ